MGGRSRGRRTPRLAQCPTVSRKARSVRCARAFGKQGERPHQALAPFGMLNADHLDREHRAFVTDEGLRTSDQPKDFRLRFLAERTLRHRARARPASRKNDVPITRLALTLVTGGLDLAVPHFGLTGMAPNALARDGSMTASLIPAHHSVWWARRRTAMQDRATRKWN
jgi:hypothetical protein